MAVADQSYIQHAQWRRIQGFGTSTRNSLSWPFNYITVVTPFSCLCSPAPLRFARQHHRASLLTFTCVIISFLKACMYMYPLVIKWFYCHLTSPNAMYSPRDSAFIHLALKTAGAEENWPVFSVFFCFMLCFVILSCRIRFSSWLRHICWNYPFNSVFRSHFKENIEMESFWVWLLIE